MRNPCATRYMPQRRNAYCCGSKPEALKTTALGRRKDLPRGYNLSRCESRAHTRGPNYTGCRLAKLQGNFDARRRGVPKRDRGCGALHSGAFDCIPQLRGSARHLPQKSQWIVDVSRHMRLGDAICCNSSTIHAHMRPAATAASRRMLLMELSSIRAKNYG